MFFFDKIDIIAFLGMITTLLFFLTNDSRRKRVIAFTSITIFLTYSILKEIYPFTILLLGILIYSIRWSIRLKKTSKSIELLQVDNQDIYIVDFLKKYKREIYNYFPFYTPAKSQHYFLIIRNMDIAGLLIGNITDSILTIELYFIKKKYRDEKIGKYLYIQNTGYFKRIGIKNIIAKSFHKGYSKFLLKMGFRETTKDDRKIFIKNID